MSLRIAGLRHAYPSLTGAAPTVILEIPELDCAPGDQVLLRGHSGSGKTTLLNILAGLLTPSAGTVEVDGQALFALPEAARDRFRALHIGCIFQTHQLLPLTALENVEMPLGFSGVRPRARRDQAAAILDQVGLIDFASYQPRQLSVGQRLRVAVARALVAVPRLLLADEPTAALDPESGAQIMALIQTSCRDQQTILITASHDPTLTELFERRLLLRGGRLESGANGRVGR